MGKTRENQKIRATKGTFHAKMDTIKDRNDMDQTEAEDIKKRFQRFLFRYQKVLLTVQLFHIVQKNYITEDNY